MNIKVLGTNCAKCKTLETNVREAVKELEIPAEVTKVDDIMDIMSYNVMRTPGLVINEKLVSSGKLLSLNQVKELITKNIKQ